MINAKGMMGLGTVFHAMKGTALREALVWSGILYVRKQMQMVIVFHVIWGIYSLTECVHL